MTFAQAWITTRPIGEKSPGGQIPGGIYFKQEKEDISAICTKHQVINKPCAYTRI